jgi:hypothetical protein
LAHFGLRHSLQPGNFAGNGATHTFPAWTEPDAADAAIGSGVPGVLEIMLFNQLGLSAELLRAIDDKGYRQATPIQQQAIPLLCRCCNGCRIHLPVRVACVF